MKRARTIVTLALAALLTGLAIAQGPPGTAAFLSFDPGQAPLGLSVEGGVPTRPVAQEGGHGGLFDQPGGLVVNLVKPLAGQGTIGFGYQPLRPLDDNQNHVLLLAGETGRTGTIALWKTGLHNDLRLRLWLADGQYVEAVQSAAGQWPPGAWHYLSVVWDADHLRLLVDGNLAGAARIPPGLSLNVTTFRLGAGDGGQEPAGGVIDDLVSYSQPRLGNLAQRDLANFLTGERPGLALPYERPGPNLALDLLPPADLTYAVVSDLHIPAGGAHGQYQHEERAKEVVRQLNALRPAFVLDGGDINTSFPGRPDFDACNQNAKTILGGLQVPIYHAPGNHDVGNKHQFDKEPFAGWFVSPANIATYERWFGPDYFAVAQPGMHCLLVNNQVFNSLPEVDGPQWDWMLKELRAHRGQKRVVVMHNPLFWVNRDDAGDNNYEVVNEPRRGQFIALCEAEGIDAVYTGHTHHAISNTIGATQLLTLPSTTFARNFGDSYGLPGLAIIWDPARIGYLLVRSRADGLHHHTIRTYAPQAATQTLLDGQPATTTRLVAACSSELRDAPVALLAPPVPEVGRVDWAVANAIDGLTRPTDTVTTERTVWTSTNYAADEPVAEWYEVTLAKPAAVRHIELWPRPDGRGFPVAGRLLVRQGGTAPWREVAAWATVPDAPARGQGLVTVLDGRPLDRVRVEMTSLPPMQGGVRASLAEVVIKDDAGQDLATELRGATAAARSSAAGDRRTLNDNLWQAARDVGATRLLVPPAELPWPAEPAAVSPSLMRVANLGRIPGCGLWLPLTPPAGASAAEVQRRAAALAAAGPGVGGLVVWAAPDQPALQAWVDAAKASPLPVAVGLTEARPLALRGAAFVLLPEAEPAVLEAVQRAVGETRLEVILGPASGADPAARAQDLGRRAVAHVQAGRTVVMPAAGTRDGVLEATGTPTPTAALVGALNTALAGLRPAGDGVFRDAQGQWAIAGMGGPRRVDLPPARRRYAVDPVAGTLWRLSAEAVDLTPGDAPWLLVGRP